MGEGWRESGERVTGRDRGAGGDRVAGGERLAGRVTGGGEGWQGVAEMAGDVNQLRRLTCSRSGGMRVSEMSDACSKVISSPNCMRSNVRDCTSTTSDFLSRSRKPPYAAKRSSAEHVISRKLRCDLDFLDSASVGIL